mmetsp:Transcript_12222/g.36767  ORF Transcript_12222/g.36767 Transcript_12222/m.36767 type:complete len:172 (-) Transcript_12222:839-1354(-)
MIRKGRDDLPGSDVERLIMWEVHVLRELGLHPHIVQVTDVIDLQDCTYIVMERIDGPELPAHVTSQPAGRLPPAEAREIFAQLLLALAHAHRCGFVHCDVKPDNARAAPRPPCAGSASRGEFHSFLGAAQSGVRPGRPHRLGLRRQDRALVACCAWHARLRAARATHGLLC